MEMGRYNVPCECGNGFKEFRKASSMAKNPGRYYFCCPARRAACSFVWADLLWSPQFNHLHGTVVDNGFHATDRFEAVNRAEGPRDRMKYGQSGTLFQGDNHGDHGAFSSTHSVTQKASKPNHPSYSANSPPFEFVCCCIGTVSLVFACILFLVSIMILSRHSVR